jgi:hypothetical protein
MLQVSEASEDGDVEIAYERARLMQGGDALCISSLNCLDSAFKPRVLAIEVVTGALVLHRSVTEYLRPIEVE